MPTDCTLNTETKVSGQPHCHYNNGSPVNDWRKVSLFARDLSRCPNGELSCLWQALSQQAFPCHHQASKAILRLKPTAAFHLLVHHVRFDTGSLLAVQDLGPNSVKVFLMGLWQTLPTPLSDLPLLESDAQKLTRVSARSLGEMALMGTNPAANTLQLEAAKTAFEQGYNELLQAFEQYSTPLEKLTIAAALLDFCFLVKSNASRQLIELDFKAEKDFEHHWEKLQEPLLTCLKESLSRPNAEIVDVAARTCISLFRRMLFLKDHFGKGFEILTEKQVEGLNVTLNTAGPGRTITPTTRALLAETQELGRETWKPNVR